MKPPQRPEATPVSLREAIDLQPPDLDAIEAREGIRALYFMHHNGTGLQMSSVKFEVLHSCGSWTTAHGNFCCHCGGQLELPEQHQAILAEHKVVAPAAQRPFKPLAAPGGFNNPLWAQQQEARAQQPRPPRVRARPGFRKPPPETT